MTEYSSSKPRVVVEWNPVIDGMAYVFKTDSENCIAYDGTGNVSETFIETVPIYNTTIYSDSKQAWIVKKSKSGGYILYTLMVKKVYNLRCVLPMDQMSSHQSVLMK